MISPVRTEAGQRYPESLGEFSGPWPQPILGAAGGLTQIVFTDQFLGIPLKFYYGVVIMLVMWYLLTFTPYGQRALFVGQSRQVARLSGFGVNARYGAEEAA